MSDIQKTEYLKRKIQQLKEDASISVNDSATKDERGAIYFLTVFILRYFAFFGSQYYILKRTAIQPFGLWETLVIYTTLLTFLSILKKK